MTRFEKGLRDPLGVFSTPDAVCDDRELDLDQKISILRRWEYDARELEVAEEENMAGGSPGVLEEVLAALRKLGALSDFEHSSPTKQGGH